MNKDNTIASSQNNQGQPGGLPISEKGNDIAVSGQNKYPKFEMGGNNYSQDPPPANQNLTSSSELQENFGTPSPTPVKSVPDSATQIIGNIQAGGVTTSIGESASNPKYASIRMRFSAYFLDAIIIGLVSIVFNLPMYISMIKASTTRPNINMPTNIQYNQTYTPIQSYSPTNPIYTILGLVPLIIAFVYYIYFIGKDGATPGKKHYKVRVVDKTTLEPPGYLKAFLREVIGKIASQFFFSLGYFWAIWDKEKQAWHDKIAGTIVVNTK